MEIVIYMEEREEKQEKQEEEEEEREIKLCLFTTHFHSKTWSSRIEKSFISITNIE
jgi:hypothetical protein